MIKKTLFIFFVIFIIWSFILGILPNDLDTAQNQFNYNIVVTEKYLYLEDIENKKVILGSSMAQWIDPDILPSTFYNLSVGGMSAVDGLEIVSRRNKKPKEIFVEINTLGIGANDFFKKNIDSNIMQYFKNLLPALKISNQPIGVLKGLLMKIMGIHANSKLESKDNAQPSQDTIDAYNQGFPEAGLEFFYRVKEKILELKKFNIEIWFFQMPIHPDLCETKSIRDLQKLTKQHFPETTYKYIPFPDCSQYQTSDGIHLVRESATAYTEYFFKQYRKIKSNNQ